MFNVPDTVIEADEEDSFMTPVTSPPTLTSVAGPPLPSFPSMSTLTTLPSSASLTSPDRSEAQTIRTPSPVHQLTPKPSPKFLLSDLSSDYFLSSPITANVNSTSTMSNTTSADQPAHVQSHGGRASPMLGRGHLHDLETMSHYADVGIAYVCQQMQKGIALPDILSNFVDGLSDNLATITWLKQNEPCLIQLPFKDFMAAFQDHFLPMTWKKDLANKIWQETMNTGIIFIDWIENLHGCNGLLTGYLEFITDDIFLSNLHGHISKPLQNAICNIPEI